MERFSSKTWSRNHPRRISRLTSLALATLTNRPHLPFWLARSRFNPTLIWHTTGWWLQSPCWLERRMVFGQESLTGAVIVSKSSLNSFFRLSLVWVDLNSLTKPRLFFMLVYFANENEYMLLKPLSWPSLSMSPVPFLVPQIWAYDGTFITRDDDSLWSLVALHKEACFPLAQQWEVFLSFSMLHQTHRIQSGCPFPSMREPTSVGTSSPVPFSRIGRSLQIGVIASFVGGKASSSSFFRSKGILIRIEK